MTPLDAAAIVQSVVQLGVKLGIVLFDRAEELEAEAIRRLLPSPPGPLGPAYAAAVAARRAELEHAAPSEPPPTSKDPQP